MAIGNINTLRIIASYPDDKKSKRSQGTASALLSGT
jgi:hypothetical protein